MEQKIQTLQDLYKLSSELRQKNIKEVSYSVDIEQYGKLLDIIDETKFLYKSDSEKNTSDYLGFNIGGTTLIFKLEPEL